VDYLQVISLLEINPVEWYFTQNTVVVPGKGKSKQTFGISSGLCGFGQQCPIKCICYHIYHVHDDILLRNNCLQM
jgi:hypothetical protein